MNIEQVLTLCGDAELVDSAHPLTEAIQKLKVAQLFNS